MIIKIQEILRKIRLKSEKVSWKFWENILRISDKFKLRKFVVFLDNFEGIWPKTHENYKQDLKQVWEILLKLGNNFRKILRKYWVNYWTLLEFKLEEQGRGLNRPQSWGPITGPSLQHTYTPRHIKKKQTMPTSTKKMAMPLKKFYKIFSKNIVFWKNMC